MCVAVIGMNKPALALSSSCRVTLQLVGITFVQHFSSSKGFRCWSLGLPLEFWGNRSAPIGLGGGSIPERAGKPRTESAVNAFGHIFAPPKLVLRHWWLAKM